MSTSTLDPTRRQLDELDALLQRMLALPVQQQDGASPVPPAPRPPVTTPAVGPAMVYTYSDTSAALPMTFTAPQAVSTYAPPAPPRVVSSPQSTAPVPQQPRMRPGEPAWTVPLPGVANGPSVLSWSHGFEGIAKKNLVPPEAQPQPVSMQPRPATSEPYPPAVDATQRMRIESISAENAQTLAAEAAVAQRHVFNGPARTAVPVVLWPLAALDWLCGNMLAGFGPLGRWLGKGSGKPLLGWSGLLMTGGAIAWAIMDYFGWSW